MNWFLDPITIAVLVASLLGVGMLIPQARDLARSRDFNGVSPSWIGGGLAINLGWIGYAIAADLPGLLPVSVGATVLYSSMTFTLRSAPPVMFRAATTSALVLGAVFIGAAIIGGTNGVGLVVASLYAAQFVPAAWSAVSAKDVSGVSLPTWAMALGEAGIWVLYGVNQQDENLVIGGLGAILVSAVIIVAVLRTSTSSAADPVSAVSGW